MTSIYQRINEQAEARTAARWRDYEAQRVQGLSWWQHPDLRDYWLDLLSEARSGVEAEVLARMLAQVKSAKRRSVLVLPPVATPALTDDDRRAAVCFLKDDIRRIAQGQPFAPSSSSARFDTDDDGNRIIDLFQWMQRGTGIIEQHHQRIIPVARFDVYNAPEGDQTWYYNQRLKRKNSGIQGRMTGTLRLWRNGERVISA